MLLNICQILFAYFLAAGFMNENETQIVMRLSNKLDRKIKAHAIKVGLTKAAWLRQLVIKTIEELERK